MSNGFYDEEIKIKDNCVYILRGPGDSRQEIGAYCKYDRQERCSTDCPMIETRHYTDGRMYLKLCSGKQYQVEP